MDPMYADYAWEQAAALLAVDSPSGYTEKAALFVQKAFEDLGFPVRRTQKGGVLVDLGGKDEQNALLLEAHTDTLGAIVAEIKSTGRLALSPLGGMSPQNAEAENLRVHTRSGKIVEGTLQLCNASIHVNGDYQKTERTWETVEAVLDEPVTCAKETRALGIEAGDIVCFEPRTRRTASGYLKSRFLDDKLSVGILLGLARYIKAPRPRGRSMRISPSTKRSATAARLPCRPASPRLSRWIWAAWATRSSAPNGRCPSAPRIRAAPTATRSSAP